MMPQRRISPFALVSAMLVAAPVFGQGTARPIAIIPRPASVTARPGVFTLTPGTIIETDRASSALGRRLALYLEPATGFELRVQSRSSAASTAASARGRISLSLDPRLKKVGSEGYILDVQPRRIALRAAGPAGMFYGIQTLRQLFPPDILREAPMVGVRWEAPAVHIEDQPRFPWRGMHLDVGRHFMPKEFVKKYLDLLALHKMNTFHWHLTEDQGWRLEIRKYPKLTQVGAWRKQTVVGHQPERIEDATFDGTQHGGYYTQDDVREIVAYAKDRFITVVPEIEMPGHSVAAIAAYPELGVEAAGTEVATTWGVFDNILSPEESTVAFMKDVLTEVMELFPSRFVHVGGDEAAKGRWKASARVQARMRELGIADEDALQSWFIHQIDSFLTANGRRLIGWDEILQGGLAPGAAVMSWQGVDGGIAAARQEHDVVMAPTSYTYFDYYQARPVAGEPPAIGGYLPLEKVYSFDPIPASLEPRYASHVLGAQGQLWTEYLGTPKNVEYMAFPRACALAEVVWSPAAAKNFGDFLERLNVHGRRLAILDVNYRVAPAEFGG